MVHSELSRGGCVTAYDNIALPHYLVHLPNQNDLVLDIEVEEDMNQRLNSGYLDGDGYNARDFDDTMIKV